MKREHRIALLAASVGCLLTVLAAMLVWPRDSSRPAAVPTPPSTKVPPPRSLPPSATATAPGQASTGETPGSREKHGEPSDAPTLPGAPPAGTGPLPDSNPVRCPAAKVAVSTAGQLEQALSRARPGDVIELADGRYAGEFAAHASGTAAQPVYLCGSSRAVLDGGDVDGGYVLHLDGAKYWRLVGFSVTDGQKGVVADATVGSVIQGLTVSHIGDEGIHLRDNSTDSVVAGNTISDTGVRRDKYGEGVYIGTAVSNWCSYSGCHADRSDRNVVKGNTITGVRAEAVDVKEGTTGGAILDNSFDGSKITGADSWVDVKGNNWLIEGNRGVNAPQDGFQTHQILDGWGNFNVFRDNRADVRGPGAAIASWPEESNVVACDNEVRQAGEGLSNIRCS